MRRLLIFISALFVFLVTNYSIQTSMYQEHKANSLFITELPQDIVNQLDTVPTLIAETRGVNVKWYGIQRVNTVYLHAYRIGEKAMLLRISGDKKGQLDKGFGDQPLADSEVQLEYRLAIDKNLTQVYAVTDKVNFRVYKKNHKGFNRLRFITYAPFVKTKI